MHCAQVLLMSDELQLDELLCLQCLLAGFDEVRCPHLRCRACHHVQAMRRPRRRCRANTPPHRATVIRQACSIIRRLILGRQVKVFSALFWCRTQRGEVLAEVGAGVYYEERRAMLGALWRILQVRQLRIAIGMSAAWSLRSWTLRSKAPTLHLCIA